MLITLPRAVAPGPAQPRGARCHRRPDGPPDGEPHTRSTAERRVPSLAPLPPMACAAGQLWQAALRHRDGAPACSSPNALRFASHDPGRQRKA